MACCLADDLSDLLVIIRMSEELEPIPGLKL